jgi:hypothetical protein
VQDRTAALTLIIAAVAGVAALEFALIVRLTRVPVSFRRWCAVGAAVAVEVVLVSLLLVLFPRPDDYIRAVLALCAGQGLLAISGMGIWMRYRG